MKCATHAVAEEQHDRLDVLASTIDVVTEEEIVRLGRKAFLVEDAQQIGVL